MISYSLNVTQLYKNKNERSYAYSITVSAIEKNTSKYMNSGERREEIEVDDKTRLSVQRL